MKTRNLFMSLSAGVLLLASCGGGEAPKADTKTPEKPQSSPKELKVDLENSVVKWKGEMMGMYSHEGTLKLTEGSLTIDNGVVTGGSFTADMKSMTATDENYDPSKEQTKEKLIGHLSSADFFAVDSFPTASFTIKSGEANASSGTLTLRGKTGEEKVENITITEKDGKVMASGTVTVDRKKYDVLFDHPAQEMVLSNDLQLTIELVAM
ncbi:MAG: YceI family protein [Flavobacteriales bacterium]|nr:YceI family protein [Flavobacteriales bacterium]